MMKILLFSLFSFSLFACPFCNEKVLKKQTVYETDKTAVLYCLTPATEGNLLILPKRHIENFVELTQDELLDIQETIHVFSEVLPEAYGASDYVLIQKNGIKAGQSVLHIHFHMIPAPVHFQEIVNRAFNYRSPITDEEMKDQVLKLRSFIAELPSSQEDGL